jgi:hypothetical protein
VSDQKSSENKKFINKIRRGILKMLYDYFKEVPYAAIELRQISEECEVSAKELNWNIVYLEKCGLVELAKSFPDPPFVSPSAVITAEGIDLVEDEFEFEKRFPINQGDEKKHENKFC